MHAPSLRYLWPRDGLRHQTSRAEAEWSRNEWMSFRSPTWYAATYIPLVFLNVQLGPGKGHNGTQGSFK